MMTSSYLTWEFVLVASSFGLILHPIIGAIPASICAIILALIVDRLFYNCLLYTSPSPRDLSTSRMPSSA